MTQIQTSIIPTFDGDTRCCFRMFFHVRSGSLAVDRPRSLQVRFTFNCGLSIWVDRCLRRAISGTLSVGGCSGSTSKYEFFLRKS